MEHLAGERLKQIVQALADDIGPRPAGSAAEERARQYLEAELKAAGITHTERLPFMTVNTWAYGLVAPLMMALLGGLFPRGKRMGRMVSAALALAAAWDLWKHIAGNRLDQQTLYPLYPKSPGGTLLARIPPRGAIKQKVVLIGHTDSNKHRPSFSPQLKTGMDKMSLLFPLLSIVHGMALLFGWKGFYSLTEKLLYTAALALIADDLDEFVDGANDNASAVACVLGIGRQAAATPLANTEIWLAFTGSEEVGLLGIHALLDHYGADLHDAYFIDFEIVGLGEIAYVTRHSSFTPLTSYTPDDDSLSLAEIARQKHPELGVNGRKIVISEEVVALRRRGFRGICLVGLDKQGWLPNWHRLSDTSAHIEPQPLETAARFAWAMLQELDAR